MNGLREYRNTVAQEDSAKRFERIEAKLDEILAALGTAKPKAEKPAPVTAPAPAASTK